jgi:hypothetical protein
MAKALTQFDFHNQRNFDINLVIEPWALVETVPAGETVSFQVNTLPMPEIEFSVTDKGDAYVYVMSERVRVIVDGAVKHDLDSPFRPPRAAFRFFRESGMRED